MTSMLNIECVYDHGNITETGESKHGGRMLDRAMM